MKLGKLNWDIKVALAAQFQQKGEFKKLRKAECLIYFVTCPDARDEDYM